ncbi:hypothetical protein BDZ91DRAFT_792306 [Kalaharituber pfeilii]|nr:hypothetical protein BDZ91DRAFT_792306 [Kalaharituber pfeilii]
MSITISYHIIDLLWEAEWHPWVFPGICVVGVSRFSQVDGALEWVKLRSLSRLSIVRASPTSHPELFWAFKGGSSNFGIVTSFKLAILENFMDKLQDYVDQNDDASGIILLFMFVLSFGGKIGSVTLFDLETEGTRVMGSGTMTTNEGTTEPDMSVVPEVFKGIVEG